MTDRLAILSFDDRPPIGGQGRYVLAVEEQMRARGMVVSMLSSRRSPWGAPKIGRRTGRAPWDYSLWLRGQLDRAAAELAPSIWHAQGGPGGVLMLKRPPGAPLVYTAHHTYRTAHGRSLATMPLGALESRGYRMAAHVMAVSASTASSVAGDSGVHPSKISVIPPGVDCDWLSPAERGSNQDEAPSILFVGRLVPVKGVQHFVAAFRSIKDRYPRLTAEVCGEGVLSGPLELAAERMPGRLKVRGKVSDQELRDTYRRASLLVVPSKYEGLGIVALEAMACGTPVLAMEVPGLRDLAGPGMVMVEPDRPGALADGICALLDDPARLQDLAAAARSRAVEEFSWAVIGDRIAEVFRAHMGG